LTQRTTLLSSDQIKSFGERCNESYKSSYSYQPVRILNTPSKLIEIGDFWFL